MNILLDTTVLIDVLRARQDRRGMLADLVEAGHSLSTASINIAEVYAGMRPAEQADTDAFLNSLECYPVTITIARRAGSLASAWRRNGRTIALPDVIVATTALEHGLTLMTDNRRDFPIPDLKFLQLA